MLTSSNQYLRPEYLSPLPTTLDAKKSPLALLAQTCSNIGADNPNNKPIIPPLEKPSKDSDKNKDKNSSEDKPAFKPYESTKKEENSNDSNDKKTPMSKTSTPIAGSCSPAGGSNASCGKASPSGSDAGSGTNVKSDSSGNNTTSTTSVSSNLSLSSVTSASQNTLSGLGYGSATALSMDLARSDGLKDGLSMSHLALGAYKAGLNPLASCTGCATVGGHLSLDGGHSLPPGLTAQNGALKQGSYPLGSALSPYVGYARVKTASGGTTLVPVCRDPYCTNCQLSMQSAQLSSCPSGCTQCTHERMTSPLGAAAVGLPGLAQGLVPGLTGSGSPSVSVAAIPGLNSHFYSHSMLPRPNVCSWMVGDTYCGKRFTTSEELLQHLRTHTNLSAGDAGSLSLISPSLSMPSVGLGAAAAACHLHYTTATSLTSPAGLRRTYPTSLSPVSSLTAASRYHPYKPQLPTLPGAPLPPIPHPGLGMYYSPYGIYGQRLGPPVHP